MMFTMANCNVTSSFAQSRMWRSPFRLSSYTRTMYSRRKYWKYDAFDMTTSLEFGAINDFKPTRLKGRYTHRVGIPKCCYIGSLVNAESIASLNWAPFIDQVLLAASILLAYMAGVVPRDTVPSESAKSFTDKGSNASTTTLSGRNTERRNQSNLDDCWSKLKLKLSYGMDAFDNDLNNNAVEKFSANCPLSLLAISGGPRLRLLCTTVHYLNKEVMNISQIHEDVNRDAWLIVSSEIVRKSIQPICIGWIAGELNLENKEQNKELIDKIYASLKGNISIWQKIRRLEKENLYADLIFFLRFGSPSDKSCYSKDMLATYGSDILEDLVITLADGISSRYLELISVDGNLSTEMSTSGLSLCTLSTRSLQKLRNEVALNSWLLQNFESVALMYEDRFELCVIQRKSSEQIDVIRDKHFSWWKRILFKKTKPSTAPLQCIVISRSPVFTKRTKELRALTGWRYYYSLFLEFFDVAMPLVTVIFGRVKSAVSFFFLCLIGRSLGLIYTGIRQSLSWR